MNTRVYCSLDYSRLGIETYEPQVRIRRLGTTKFHKISKDGKVRWIYTHKPSEEYMHAREIFMKTFSTGCINIRMSQWKMMEKRRQEESDNRCATLAARIFRSRSKSKSK